MFFLPLFDNNPTVARPFVTWIIMALCVSGFIWQESLDYRTAHNIVYQLGFIPAVFFTPANLPENMTLVPEWSTIFTSMFLHAGWMHIGGNMLYLWIFGDNVEAAMGRGRFVLFYMICGTAAAMAQAALDPSSTIPMIGASGGIAGILGAYLLLHPKAAIRCFFLILIFFRFINLPAWLVLGVMDWRAICCRTASLERNRRRRGLSGAYWRVFGWHGADPIFQIPPYRIV